MHNYNFGSLASSAAHQPGYAGTALLATHLPAGLRGANELRGPLAIP